MTRRLQLLGPVCALVLAGCARPLLDQPAAGPNDLSGLAWVAGGIFLAVHDAKVDEEAALPRVSLLTAPRPAAPMRWTPLDVDWPAEGPISHDLESVARVPGTDTYLLAESGDGGSTHRRIFVAELAGAALTIREAASWPFEVFDVEGTAVALVGEDRYFLFAERAHGEAATRLVWARLSLAPFTLGTPREVTFTSPWPTGEGARPVSALDVDAEGYVYAASAYDPDRDDGPFRSAVWRIGRIVPAAEGAEVDLLAVPERLATLDGLKVEALAVRPDGAGGVEVVVGTDDEAYGGVLRRLP